MTGTLIRHEVEFRCCSTVGHAYADDVRQRAGVRRCVIHVKVEVDELHLLKFDDFCSNNDRRDEIVIDSNKVRTSRKWTSRVRTYTAKSSCMSLPSVKGFAGHICQHDNRVSSKSNVPWSASDVVSRRYLCWSERNDQIAGI